MKPQLRTSLPSFKCSPVSEASLEEHHHVYNNKASRGSVNPFTFSDSYDKCDTKSNNSGGADQESHKESGTSEFDPYMTFNKWSDNFKAVLKKDSPKRGSMPDILKPTSRLFKNQLN